MVTPRCATAAQYEAWEALSKHTTGLRAGFCSDCTLEYQDRMKREGRCEHPNVKFDQEGGYMPKEWE